MFNFNSLAARHVVRRSFAAAGLAVFLTSSALILIDAVYPHGYVKAWCIAPAVLIGMTFLAGPGALVLGFLLTIIVDAIAERRQGSARLAAHLFGLAFGVVNLFISDWIFRMVSKFRGEATLGDLLEILPTALSGGVGLALGALRWRPSPKR